MCGLQLDLSNFGLVLRATGSSLLAAIRGMGVVRAVSHMLKLVILSKLLVCLS